MILTQDIAKKGGQISLSSRSEKFINQALRPVYIEAITQVSQHGCPPWKHSPFPT